jgi:hypothetical protein
MLAAARHPSHGKDSMHRLPAALLLLGAFTACGGSPYVGTYSGGAAADITCPNERPLTDWPVAETITISGQDVLYVQMNACANVPAALASNLLTLPRYTCAPKQGVAGDGTPRTLLGTIQSGTLSLTPDGSLQVSIEYDVLSTGGPTPTTCHIAERGTLTRQK